MEDNLAQLKRVQAKLDKLRDRKNTILSRTERSIEKLETERLSLRALRENIMMKLAR